MVFIAGGGTGGHLFPGIAVAEEFRARDSETEVVFMGTEKGLEANIVPKEGYPIKFLRVEGVLGRSPLGKLLALWKLFRSVFYSRGLFMEALPDIVVGTGGYVSAGPVAAAKTLSIPTLLLEQNLVPGLANRVLSRIADMVAVTYHESMSFFPRIKTSFVGNPVRSGILTGKKKNALRLFSLEGGKLTVLVLGGSRGARKINNAMLDALNLLLDARNEMQFLHQTGDEDYETVRKRYRELGFRAMVAPFVYQMPEAYAVADILVSRAGATTVAELTALGKASILIPYPHAGGHQEFNAQKLQEMGGCRVLNDRELSGDDLAREIRRLSESEELRNEMRKNSRALGRPDAARKVVDLAMSLVKARARHV
jgi:UDP-N-acetylglucosamine--N-acetylmuramyl-(pentapeptide) pyrophosphoryl-undecaprenol N-acetylglucosamine transferase